MQCDVLIFEFDIKIVVCADRTVGVWVRAQCAYSMYDIVCMCISVGSTCAVLCKQVWF